MSDASAGGGSLYLQAVQLGPHTLGPTDRDPSGQYTVNGELIGFTMTIAVGNIFGSSGGVPPDCSSGTPNWTRHLGTRGLLVQFNKNFAPTPGANSYLVKEGRVRRGPLAAIRRQGGGAECGAGWRTATKVTPARPRGHTSSRTS